MVGVLIGDKFAQLVYNGDLLLVHLYITDYNKMVVSTGLCVIKSYHKELDC